MNVYEKLGILADSAKYDVACSTSGVGKNNRGKIGNKVEAGICHSWSEDGRCIGLLKILMSNKCAYNCLYCVNRRGADVPRASFEPEELAALTMEFYRRNYIEGLFISSAVEKSPDDTGEKILRCLQILRHEYEFCGYIHAKIIPGTSSELVQSIGMEADRVSVNIELPCKDSLAKLAPEKKPEEIVAPMKQITTALLERNALKGPGNMFKNKGNAPLQIGRGDRGNLARKREIFVPAGQTTQMIIGAKEESDLQILNTTEKLYHLYGLKRVYYSAYIPVVSSPHLPSLWTKPALLREHRLYQADWLLRFYGFSKEEIVSGDNPYLDPDMDPKLSWALRHMEMFPMEVNKVGLDQLLRVPGIGMVSATRIMQQRRFRWVTAEDLKKMGVVWKRTKFFITCNGKYLGEREFSPKKIKSSLLSEPREEQLSMFQREENHERLSI